VVTSLTFSTIPAPAATAFHLIWPHTHAAALIDASYNREPTDATAFVHRHELFLLKHAVVVDPDASTAERGAARRWLARSWSSTHPWGSGGVYPNFPDPELQDWAHAYYGTNFERLVRVKGRYDPDDFFNFQQSLPRGR
jgi:Berberine and berberine like